MQFFRSIFIVIILTLLTQVGGLIYLLYLPIKHWLTRRINSRWKVRLFRWSSFAIIYMLINLIFVPPLARQLGRLPLPWYATEEVPLQPANWVYCLANRHYVQPALYQLVAETAQKMATVTPYSKLIYLDANFPFFDGFPLLPHLSHNDGRKLDLAFLYQKNNSQALQSAPSTLGYGYNEPPKSHEINQPEICSQRGYWQYSLTTWLSPTISNPKITFNEAANRHLLQLFATNAKTGKIFIEPHLKQRLDLGSYSKIRFHGCQAVRHDDHIHIQL
ncbi:MAG: hypothetical protein DHS20C18_26210 [Saprospiraceae bacterium]|nr:MAG: hypothetical protein DHS20C18_26210 [Saprospiraceae bacterium]